MTPERFQRIDQLLSLALGRPASNRSAFIRESCAGDEDLRIEVESLLTSYDENDGFSMQAASQLAAEVVEHPLPTAIGHYRILSIVGEGGMGVVYQAEQEHPRRIVALKVIRPLFTTAELLRRFHRESQALGRLQHPGIAQIYEAGVADTGFGPQPYFAMEFIRGLSLLEYARAHNLNTRQRLELITKVCDAVHHAHQRGVIHRDLKPSNVLVDESGQPKILDFGVAQIRDEENENRSRYTNPGDVIGTLTYMSPEQVLADPAQLDARSDVYTLGIVAYELVTGRLPYEVSRLVHQAAPVIRSQDPAPLERSYRGDLETILGKALEKEKTRRYSSAADFAADIRRFLQHQPILARPPSVGYQLRKFAIRNKTLVGAILVVFGVLLVGTVISTRQAIRANRERDRALRAERISTAVTDFLQNDLLAQAGARAQARRHSEPDPELKVRTALDRAAERIAGKFDSQPEVEASIRRTIGLAYFDLNLYTQAQNQLERAAEVRKRVLGPEHLDTLTSLDELGVLYNYQGKGPQAEALLAQVSQTRSRLLGGTHKDTLATMAHLALAISYGGDDARAAPIFVQVLEAERRAQGEEHIDTLSVMDSLGTVYLRLGKFAEAEELFRREGELDRRVLGPEHPDTTDVIHNLGSVYRAQGKYAQAEAFYSAALAAQIRALGEGHWQTLYTRCMLGATYRAEGKYREAELLISRAAEALKHVVGAEHPVTLQGIYQLGELYRRQKRFGEAAAIFHKVLDARRRVMGADNPWTAQVLASLGQLKLEQHAYADAEKPLREAVQAREKRSPDSWERYFAQSLLGASLMGLGKYAEAGPLLTSGYQGMLERQSSIPAEYRPALEQAHEWIAQLETTKH